MISQRSIDNNIGQGIASYVDYVNNLRLSDLMKNIELILTNETDSLANVASRKAQALSNIELASREINNLINTNRGGNTGIHGYIAEFAETGIRNARNEFEGLCKSVQILNNNGPADILLQGEEIQMKFFSNLSAEIKQASNYQQMKMMFPKDHMEIYQKIMNGERIIEFNGEKLSSKKITNIKTLIEEECKRRGCPFEKWAEPSVNSYGDVQKAAIDRTLSNETNNISKQAGVQEDNIKNDAMEDRISAQQASQASFGEATKMAGVGATVQGGLNLGIYIYKKHKSGKEIWEFSTEDWKESGIELVKGVTKGGISGYSIYGLTNVCHLSAPSAGAITTGTFGLINAVIQLRTGKVDDDGFVELVTMNTIEATGAAIGAAVGSAVIPVPVVGALIGSIIASTSLSLGKNVFNKHEKNLLEKYKNRVYNFIQELDIKNKMEIETLMNKYRKLGEIQEYSFDVNININLQFNHSIELAKLVGVSERKILHSESEIDNYFLS